MRTPPIVPVALALLGAGCHRDPQLAVLCPRSGHAEVYGRSVGCGIQVAVEETDDALRGSVDRTIIGSIIDRV